MVLGDACCLAVLPDGSQHKPQRSGETESAQSYHYALNVGVPLPLRRFDGFRPGKDNPDPGHVEFWTDLDRRHSDSGADHFAPDYDAALDHVAVFEIFNFDDRRFTQGGCAPLVKPKRLIVVIPKISERRA
jgi:hypothetical protein